MKVLICGSRGMTIYTKDIDCIFSNLGFIVDYNVTGRAWRKYYSNHYITEIISGGAVGPDTAALIWAELNGCSRTVFLPEWEKHGNLAGIIRNKKMVKECDVCIGFWDGKSRGTKFTLEYATKSGKKTYVVEYSNKGIPDIKWDISELIYEPYKTVW
jgi:hypothetical protein